MNDDSSLREQFASLRRADAASAPSFLQVTSRAGNQFNDTPWKVGLAACIVLTATVATIWVARVAPPGGSVHAPAPMLADWRAPTDFLLDTPGRDLLHTIPNLTPDSPTGVGPLPPTLMITPAPRAAWEHS
jgi:hypothetical protein